MEYHPLVVPLQPKHPHSAHSPESRRWRQFKHPVFVKEYAPITSIHFAPSSPHRYAVTAATRVQIYAPRTQKITKTISRFKDVARSGTIRADGKLVVAGDDTGLVQVFDINSRAILRTLDSHKQPVHVTKFSTLNQTQVLSCSDDTTVKVWDVPSQSIVNTFSHHTDYVRSGQFSPVSPHTVLTGSYDSTMRLFDTRSGQCEMVMSPATSSADRLPVEQVLMLPSATLAVASTGPILRIWDLVAGGKCSAALSNHQKTITALALNGAGDRLLTGSLDHMVKVCDLSSLKVVHTMRYPAPLLCVAISPDDTHIAAGMSDGTLSVRRRQPKPSESVDPAAALSLPVTQQSKLAGIADEIKIDRNPTKRLREHDKLLKGFKYSAALDSVLKKNTRPSVTFALIRELVHRDGLRTALAGRDDVTLEPILRLLIKYVIDPRFGQLVVDTTSLLIEIYQPVLGQNPLIDGLFLRLRKKIAMELRFQEQVHQVDGALTMMLSCCGVPR